MKPWSPRDDSANNMWETEVSWEKLNMRKGSRSWWMSGLLCNRTSRLVGLSAMLATWRVPYLFPSDLNLVSHGCRYFNFLRGPGAKSR